LNKKIVESNIEAGIDPKDQ
jgi:hypothetical protein